MPKRYAPRTLRYEGHDLPREGWWASALCAQSDPFLFHPQFGASDIARQALSVCQVCPVRRPCLTYALSIDERGGIWGGFTGRARRGLHQLVNRGASPADVAIVAIRSRRGRSGKDVA